MSVQILTDSTSDILPEEAEQKGVRVVPLLVNFGEEAFRENVEITHQEYFRRLAQAESLPTTSQPTPQALEQLGLRYRLAAQAISRE